MQKKIFGRVVALSLFVVVGLMSCNSTNFGLAAGSSLSGDWQVNSVIVGNNAVTKPNGISPTLSISSAKGNSLWTGFAGVNNFSGTVNIKDDSVTVVTPFVMTLMAGDPAAEQFERALISVLNNVASVEHGENGLVIRSSDANSIVLSRQSIVGQTWELAGYNIGKAVSSLDEEVVKPYITIDSDKSVSGWTGANNMNGDLALNINERTIKFSNLSWTRMAARNPATALVEESFVNLLEKADSYILSGNTLTLLQGKITVLVFTKK